MPRSPRRQTIFAAGGKHNVALDDLPVAVARSVAQTKRAEMQKRHARQRQEIYEELRRLETRMDSDAFTADIRRRLSRIRAQLKSPSRRTKSVRFADGTSPRRSK